MKNPVRLIVGCLLIVASARIEFAKGKPAGHKAEKIRSSAVAMSMMPAAGSPVSQALEPPSVGKSIVVLQTREYRVTIFSGQQEPRYSVATDKGIALAHNLSGPDLQSRFPELHEIVTGTAWAGLDLRGFSKH